LIDCLPGNEYIATFRAAVGIAAGEAYMAFVIIAPGRFASPEGINRKRLRRWDCTYIVIEQIIFNSFASPDTNVRDPRERTFVSYFFFSHLAKGLQRRIPFFRRIPILRIRPFYFVEYNRHNDECIKLLNNE
jgi:hypothetical protein